MLNTLHSITKIETVYQTGQKPLLVTTSDLNDYVVKYSDSQFENILMAEYQLAYGYQMNGLRNQSKHSVKS